MISIVAFPIKRLVDSQIFTAPGTQVYPFQINRPPVNWNFPDTETLYNQVKNEYISAIQLETICRTTNPAFNDIVAIGRLDQDQGIVLDEYKITQSKSELCKKYIDRAYDYSEVFSRDQDAFEQENFNVKLYAIVLLRDNQYYGHIYTWLSPISSTVLAMGIRNRVDSIFIKGTEDDLPGVSRYLLEGVRQFALSKGSAIMSIVHPRPIMQQILPHFGFIKTPISAEIIGQSIAPDEFFDKCYNCYIRLTEQPLTQEPVSFTLLE